MLNKIWTWSKHLGGLLLYMPSFKLFSSDFFPPSYFSPTPLPFLLLFLHITVFVQNLPNQPTTHTDMHAHTHAHTHKDNYKWLFLFSARICLGVALLYLFYRSSRLHIVGRHWGHLFQPNFLGWAETRHRTLCFSLQSPSQDRCELCSAWLQSRAEHCSLHVIWAWSDDEVKLVLQAWLWRHS